MELVVLPRQYGKTTKAVEWLRANPDRVMLTFQWREKLRLVGILEELDEADGIARRVVPWDKRVFAVGDENLHGVSHARQLGVDNVELVLSNLLNWYPSFMTVNDPRASYD